MINFPSKSTKSNLTSLSTPQIYFSYKIQVSQTSLVSKLNNYLLQYFLMDKISYFSIYQFFV